MLLHQLAYALLTLDALDTNLKVKLDNAYERAKLGGVPWANSFSLLDRKEYLASGVS